MPVPAKSQWLSLVHVQSAEPLAGEVVPAPISSAGSGPCCFHGFLKLRSRSEFAPPNLPIRSIVRLAAPAAPARISSNPSTELPQKNAALTPESMARFTWSYIASDQYSSWPTETKALALSSRDGSACVSIFEM